VKEDVCDLFGKKTRYGTTYFGIFFGAGSEFNSSTNTPSFELNQQQYKKIIVNN